MMCEYAGAEYEPKLFEARGTKRSFEGLDKSDWFVEAKPDLVKENALTNLPYVKDGDVMVTQTVSCLLYLGRKFKLVGEKPEDLVKVEQIACEAQDLRNATVGLMYRGNPESWKAHLDDNVKKSYSKFEEWLNQQGSLYTAGATPTAGDFHLWEMVDQIELLATSNSFTSPLAGFEKLKALYMAFRKEPKMQKYFDGNLYKLPCNNIMAQFGCDYIEGQERARF